MSAVSTEPMARVKAGGIKLSERQLLVRGAFPIAGPDLTAVLIGLAAEQRINMAFLSRTSTADLDRLVCCVPDRDQERLATLVGSRPDLDRRLTLGPLVGVLSVFPHHRRIQLFGLLLSALGQAGIALYGSMSSISTISFVVAYDDLGRAVGAVEGHLQLPANAAPLKPQFRVEQSPIAKPEGQEAGEQRSAHDGLPPKTET